MVSNAYLTWSRLFGLCAQLHSGLGLHQTPKWLPLDANGKSPLAVPKILNSGTYTRKPRQQKPDSPTVLSLLTLRLCPRTSSLQAAAFLLQWVEVTTLCLHGEVYQSGVILNFASRLPKCDILLSIVGLLYTKYVGSKNRTEGWCRKMAFKQPPRVKLFWTKMVGVWTWCSRKRQVQKGTFQSGLPIFQMLYYCNAAILCVHVISSARRSLRSQILFIIRIQKSAWLIAKFKHDSVSGHMNKCTNKSQDVVF